MSKASDSEKLEVLRSRIRASKKIMEQEKKQYWQKCRDFFEGKHWPEYGYEKMRTINLIWSSVRTLLASQYFRDPHFTLKPRKPEFEAQKDLHEAILDYWVKKALLKPVARACVQAAFTDFAVITWGCDTKFDKDGKAKKDSFYFKKIEPERFFPDHSSKEQLFEKIPGFGVEELMRPEEVKRRWGEDIEATESVYNLEEERQFTPYQNLGIEAEVDMKRVRVYKYYDKEVGKLYIFAKGHDEFLDISDCDSDSIPYSVLKYNEKPSGGEAPFYPLPEVYHLIDAQKIIEIAASMAVEHMKRSARKVEVQEGQVDAVEEEKLENPESMTVVHVKKRGMIGPIDMGPADSSIFNVGTIFGSYFDQISSVNVARRGGEAQRLTATAESIIDKYGMNRSNDTIALLSDFMCKVGKGFLDTLQENLTVPGVIQISDEMGAAQWFSYLPTIDLTGDFECQVQIGETAPKDDQVERAQWIDCLGVLQQNPLILQSPLLTKETLARFNIENPALVKEIVGIGQRAQMQQQQMQQQQQQAQIQQMAGQLGIGGATGGNTVSQRGPISGAGVGVGGV